MHLQVQKFTSQMTVEFLVIEIKIKPSLLGMEFLHSFELRKNKFFIPRKIEFFPRKIKTKKLLRHENISF